MFEPWFVWALVGVGCIGLEIILPGFVIFFFGLGGIATAMFSLIPSVTSAFWLQILLFVVFSVLSLVFLRRRFSRVFAGTVFDSRKGDPEEEGIGETAEVIETVGTVREGRVRFRGTSWKARAREGELAPGSMAKILAREGMTYIVEATDASSGKKGGT